MTQERRRVPRRRKITESSQSAPDHAGRTLPRSRPTPITWSQRPPEPLERQRYGRTAPAHHPATGSARARSKNHPRAPEDMRGHAALRLGDHEPIRAPEDTASTIRALATPASPAKAHPCIIGRPKNLFTLPRSEYPPYRLSQAASFRIREKRRICPSSSTR